MAEHAGELDARLGDRAYIEPPKRFVEQANADDPGIYERFEEGFPEAFEAYAELLGWDERWDEVFDASDPPFFEWFVGGQLNASANCVDRHVEAGRGDAVAVEWVGEDGARRSLTYEELLAEVEATAALLREQGVGEDDVVTIHLPMVPALPVTMLACARIGAPHSVVFGGFSASAVADRIDDAGSRTLVTIDGYYRRGEFQAHKEKADRAVQAADTDVDTVLVFAREDELTDGVTLAEHEVRADERVAAHREAGRSVEPVSHDAEDPLFVMYTSGTTGAPKGCQHRTGGYLAYVAATSKLVLDVKPEDVYWCAADIGWITGHSYIVYGPLALGTTTVMYEGAPDHPHRGRLWEIAEDLGVDIFHTSPTAVRMFMKWGAEHLEGYDLGFRLLTTVGEPIQVEAWRWYHEHVGGGDAVVVDTWWQTETGGHLITNLPALAPMKPGSAGRACPGIEPAIVDDDGTRIEPESGKAGNLVIERPWPGMLQTVYGDDERFLSTYWEDFSDTSSDDWRDWTYKAGDGAVHEEDGYWRILGRLDDVLNVAGHRLGTMELENAIAEVPAVAEPAVVGKDHPEKGTVPDAYVTLREDAPDAAAVRSSIVEAVEEEVGPFARPAGVHVVDELPKTRSGKIMRRLLQQISNGEPLGDTTTLKDPSVPEAIREQLVDR